MSINKTTQKYLNEDNTSEMRAEVDKKFLPLFDEIIKVSDSNKKLLLTMKSSLESLKKEVTKSKKTYIKKMKNASDNDTLDALDFAISELEQQEYLLSSLLKSDLKHYK